jgi:5'(3')-deoxyribonucleotidase
MLPLKLVDPEELKHVFIDMDGVLAHFSKSKLFQPYDNIMRKPPRMYEDGFFEGLPPLDGARWAIRVLLKNPKLKVHILTKPPTNSIASYSEKAAWISKNFPELLDSIFIGHDKDFLAGPGRVLIDDFDMDWRAGWEKAGGEFIHFNTDNSRDEWIRICLHLNPDYFNQGEL